MRGTGAALSPRMEATTSPDAPSSPTCAPYRCATLPDAPRPTVTPPRSRALTVASFALSALATIATLTSLHLTATLVGLTRVSTAMATARLHTMSTTALGGALEDLSRRERAPLYIAPGIDERSLRQPVIEVVSGTFRESVRALDARLASRGLWLHVDDGVLRLEREVKAADLDCTGTLESCATRLERLASITVQRSEARALGPVHLRVTRDVPAVEATRAALVREGYQVDVVGRTLYVSGEAAPRADASSEPAVRATGRGVFVVSRRSIDAMLERQQELMRSTRIVPVTRGGRVVGVRVFGIAPGDRLAGLGIANGDVIERINGYDVASPDRCLEAYARLRASNEVTVELERAGRRVWLVYVIV